MDPKWYHVCWPRLTAERVEPVVSISWASCYSCDTKHSAVLAMERWLAGWLAVTRRYCVKTAKPILKLFRPSGSPSTLVLDPLRQTPEPNSKGNPVISSKTLPKWAWIGNFKPNWPNIKIAISRKILTRWTCSLRRMLGSSNTSHGWSAMTSHQIQDGERPPFWKSKIRNNSVAHRPSWPNFAWQQRHRRKFEFFTKIAKMWKSKMADGRLFENIKYEITRPRIVRPDYNGVAPVDICHHQLSFLFILRSRVLGGQSAQAWVIIY